MQDEFIKAIVHTVGVSVATIMVLPPVQGVLLGTGRVIGHVAGATGHLFNHLFRRGRPAATLGDNQEPQPTFRGPVSLAAVGTTPVVRALSYGVVGSDAAGLDRDVGTARSTN